MITKHGLFFQAEKVQAEKDTQYFGLITYAIHIYADGKVTMVGNKRYDGICNYETVQEFADAQPLIAKDIIDYCRANGKNLDTLIAAKGTDIVPITKQCRTCHKVFPVTQFPINELAFDKAHSDCCECRIKECQRISAWCAAPIKKSCLSCPVRKPDGM
jgi:hypothetical protein